MIGGLIFFFGVAEISARNIGGQKRKQIKKWTFSTFFLSFFFVEISNIFEKIEIFAPKMWAYPWKTDKFLLKIPKVDEK